MLTKKERIVLYEIRKNSRQSFAKMSRNLNIPVTTIFETHKKLESIIYRYTTIIVFEALGFPIRVLINIQDSWETINFLKSSHEVNNLQLTDNGLLAEAIFKTPKDKHVFLEKLKYHDSNIKNYELVEEIKRESMCIE